MKRQPWHDALLQSLAQLADTEQQKRAWVEEGIPSFPSPTELVCQAFDDSGIDDLLASGPVFSEAADRLLREMSTLAGDQNLDLGQPPHRLLDDSRWKQLTLLASLAAKAVSTAVYG